MKKKIIKKNKISRQISKSINTKKKVTTNHKKSKNKKSIKITKKYNKILSKKKYNKTISKNNKFSIADFCDVQGQEFKKYYEYLNNPVIVQMCVSMIPQLMSEKIQMFLLEKIKANKDILIDKMRKVDTIISFYEMNDDIKYSDVGQFFTFYQRVKTEMKINEHSTPDKYLLFFNELILYPKVLSVLKECFYIFSDRRSCVYYLTPGINFSDSTPDKKKSIERVVKHFKNNISMMTQMISKTYQFNDNPWGSKYYSSAYATFDTFQILRKYFKDPFKECDLTVKTSLRKFPSKEKQIEYLCKMYHEFKFSNSQYNSQINPNHIQNATHFLIALKKLGYDLWFILPLMIDSLYDSYEIDNITFPIHHCDKYIHLQSNNFKIGIMAYLLVRDGFITNTNVFRA